MPRNIAFFIGFVLPCSLHTGPLAAQPSSTRPLEISVNATEAPRRLLRATMRIPVKPGPLTLHYPKWIQGEHSPNGPINDLAGFKLRVKGTPLPWRRDGLDLYSFHCVIPDGVDMLEVALEYLGSAKEAGGGLGSSAPCMTPKLAMINWHLVLVYPKGHAVGDLRVNADMTVPQGWKLGTALPIASEKDGKTTFKTVSLEMLADSPVLCGQHFQEIPLGPAQGPPHYLTLACDSAAGLTLAPELKRHYERLVLEAGALFGTRHYRSYRFLVAMSDHINHFAIEHHESSDNRVPEKFLTDDTYRKTWHAWVLPHEFVHSWNGKYRRPEGLVLPDYQKPMRTQLLWVYEGLTQYLGFVLTARSGLYTPEIARENWAHIASWSKLQRGRDWRSLQDTAVAAPHLYFARGDWASRRRGVDFYDEGALLWFDIDTLIREKSRGKNCLDDFCRAFFSGKGGEPSVKAYAFKDIVKTLNEVAPNDWNTFLERRLNVTEGDGPLDGIARAGWKLTYRDRPGELYKARETDEKSLYLSASLGFVVTEEGKITDITPGSLADKARIGPGMKLLAVNDRRFSAERLRAALASKQKLRLLLENQDFFRNVTLDYTAGDRYPHLERDARRPDLVLDIMRARAKLPQKSSGANKE
ncbi:MAG: M61 family metallopeptidase [Planctomycetes bacterium]|nr:M61 family metallopeptidase [Planctomycetota bacterium]